MLFGGVYVFNRDPLIVGAMGVNELQWARSLRDVKVVIYWPAWYWTRKTVPSLLKYKLQFLSNGIKLRFACNSPDEITTLKSFGISAELINLNCFVNEHIFRPIHTVAERYDAIYIAQMLKIKRIELAKDIEKLFVVTYGEHKDKDGNYDLHTFEPAVRHCDFNRNWISSDAIAVKINESAVSLALSPHEGAMLAVVESLLCGTPVISTPCRGGRELFFNSQTSHFCSPDPAAIANAVDLMARSRIDKEIIRNITLSKIHDHRLALNNLVSNLLAELGGKINQNHLLDEFSSNQGSRALFVDRKDFERLNLV